MELHLHVRLKTKKEIWLTFPTFTQWVKLNFCPRGSNIDIVYLQMALTKCQNQFKEGLALKLITDALRNNGCT